jgi:transketolase
LAGVNSSSTLELERIAAKVRRNIVSMIATAGSGHPGGSLSVTDILVALYFAVMRRRADDPDWSDRDRLILSKGHAAPALYAVLAEAGILDAGCLLSLRKMGSILQGHPCRHCTPGVEIAPGSMGQGVWFSNGLALALRLDKRPSRVFCITGDGELEEGQVWEAAMLAAHYKLDNVIAVVDNNGLQIDGWTKDVMSVEPLADKWRSFGWNVVSADGHSFSSLLGAFEEASSAQGRPSVIIAHTIKGKGVSFMENNAGFHGKAPNKDEFVTAMAELDQRIADLGQAAGEVK